jgi:hypothetical protein
MSTSPTPTPGATAASVSSVISEVSGIAEGILTALETVDPALALPAEIIAEIAKLASTAFAALSAAQGTPITVASVQALLVSTAPLNAPTS